MVRPSRVVLLVALLVAGASVAGVLLSSQPFVPATTDAADAGTPTATPPATTTRQATTTTATATTATATTTITEPARENPWGRDVVVVGLDDGNASRPVAPLVERALTYWERNATGRADYRVEFAFRPNASAPDLEVRLVNALPHCGEEESDVETYLGCAPVLEPGTRAEPPETVRIVLGYDNETTLTALKHEFGHVLGVEHGEEPMPVMAAVQADATRQPAPDARGRRYPFRKGHVDVYVDVGSVDAPPAAVNEQIDRVVAYFNASAGGNVPALLVVDRTANRSEAEIVVQGTDRLSCRETPVEAGSCGPLFGYDPDDDGALEYFTRQNVTIKGLPAEVIGWYVGYHVAVALNPDETFHPFVPDAPYDLRAEWWERTDGEGTD